MARRAVELGDGNGETKTGSAIHHAAQRTRIHRECAAGRRAERRENDVGVQIQRLAAGTGPRLSVTFSVATPLFLEKREMAARHRIHVHRPRGFLGELRVSHARRPLFGGAFFVASPAILARSDLRLGKAWIEGELGYPWIG